MKILNPLPSEFQKALPILESIRQAGYEAYFVGGSVRDSLLGQAIHDVDIATSAYPQEIKQIFERTIDVGIEHGTVLVLTKQGEYEVTTFRTEDVYVDYRRPSQVSFVRSLTEDLKRRDFTVNAFALSETGEVIDQFDGLLDLSNQTLRAVGLPQERFKEDALRIMRGFRFVASLGFEIEEQTFVAMTACAPLLEKISVERSFIEFDKLLMAPYWKKGIEALVRSEAYDYLPEMAGQGASLTQLWQSLEADFSFACAEQAWAYVIICLDCSSKPFLKKWKTSVNFQKTVSQLVEAYHYRQTNDWTLRQLYDYGQGLLLLVEELRQGLGLSVDLEAITQLADQLSIRHKTDILVKGADLMAAFAIKPGPQLGQLLTKIEDRIVMGKLANDRQAILTFVEGELDG
ncbi:CCA tRNA nucleotidyltransferase [Streptococcus cuniculipharyngis]|uniref:CCA-adding enzyme n=1 Tax=Streptococcus cuniculipharyngis TaxID=1562651 RepID=A0A5C5SGP7_9STRE|nr:CCA tRNA nucleotidyltransferase [Streptococcus cuniculipharyngis]TWS99081.1 CCA tRNA nucleotidyltransferase [Streptococcus cuniculipharyngis]